MSVPGYSISKTSFLKFEQCEKAFFLYKNHPYLRDKISIDKMLTFKRGHDVGFFAQQLFPGGTDASLGGKNAMTAVETTRNLLNEKKDVIYEASFLHNGVLIMVDILVCENDRYTAYEIKSSLKVSESYLKDAHLQYYVLKNALQNFEDLFLVTLNPDYVLEQEIEPKKLFRKRSVKQKAEENAEYFNHRINAAHEVLEKNTIPNIAIGTQCFKPYLCDYFGTCWKDDMSENSVFNLPFIGRDKLFEWHNQGLKTIAQLNNNLLEKDVNIKIKDAFLKNEAIVDAVSISKFLEMIQSPAIVMDMEVWSAAIPQIEGTKCFEQVPFLVSFYDGKMATNYFAEHKTDNRKEFAEKLIELSQAYKSVIVYDKNLEVGVINSLINRYQEHKIELENLKSKIVDVFDVFQKLWYYHPQFKSTFSLKTISSFLLPQIKYPKISSGLEAMNFYEKYRQSVDLVEREVLKEELIVYCNTDCEATYKLVEFLKAKTAD